jgi:hypothetical protein
MVNNRKRMDRTGTAISVFDRCLHRVSRIHGIYFDHLVTDQLRPTIGVTPGSITVYHVLQNVIASRQTA